MIVFLHCNICLRERVKNGWIEAELGENHRGVRRSQEGDLQLQVEASKTDLDRRIGALRLFSYTRSLFELRTLDEAWSPMLWGDERGDGVKWHARAGRHSPSDDNNDVTKLRVWEKGGVTNWPTISPLLRGVISHRRASLSRARRTVISNSSNK